MKITKSEARKIAKEIKEKFDTNVNVMEWQNLFLLELEDEVDEEELTKFIDDRCNRSYISGFEDEPSADVESSSLVSLYK